MYIIKYVTMNIPKQFKKYSGKKGSAYMWVLLDYDKDSFINHLKIKMESSKNIRDSVIRGIVNNIYYNLLQTLEDNSKIKQCMNYVVLATPDDNCLIKLEDEWKKILQEFKCSNITLQTSNQFDINWLNHYLTDSSYVYSVSVVNNKFKIHKINQTKSVCIVSEEHKSTNIDKFISDNIPGEKYILHGSSVKLKNFKVTSDTLIFEQKHLGNDIVLEMYERKLNHINFERVEEILGYLKNDKEIDRVVFGKNKVAEKLMNGYLEELYCYRKFYNKLISNMEKKGIKVGTKIIPLDFNAKDTKTHTLQPYDGVMGLSYNWAKTF